jgi:hypothetical protein
MSEAPILSPLVWDGERAPLAKALVAAQKATEAVKKASTNSHFNNKYADLAVVVEAVVPALNAAGVAVIQSPSSDGQLVGVTTVLLHEGGSMVTGTLHLRPTKQDPQGVGSAITYARRYALLAMTGAAPEDDDGNAASGPGNDRARPEPKRTEVKEPTLSDRAEHLAATLKDCRADQVERAWKLAEKLRAELAQSDPDRLAALTQAYEFRKPQPEKEAA